MCRLFVVVLYCFVFCVGVGFELLFRVALRRCCFVVFLGIVFSWYHGFVVLFLLLLFRVY